MALTKLTFNQLKEEIPDILKAGEVPFIQGKPGVGKSAFARWVAKEFNLFLLDVRLTTFDPTMMNGFLWIDPNNDKATFRSLDVFPVEGDEIPINPETGKPYAGFLIFLDELTQTPKSVEGAAFRLILDKEVGNKKLHPKALMMGAGNPPGMGMIAKPLSTPMRSRLIHFEMENKLQEFINNCIDLDFHPLVPPFFKSNPECLNNFEDNAGNIDGTYACERSWEKLSNILKVKTKNGKKIEEKNLPTLTGTVGEHAGGAFYAFLKSYYACPNISDIAANPGNTYVPVLEIDQYASLAYLVENVTLNNGAAVAVYVKRFNEEFGLIFGKLLLKKKEDVFDAHFEYLTDLVVKYALAS